MVKIIKPILDNVFFQHYLRVGWYKFGFAKPRSKNQQKPNLATMLKVLDFLKEKIFKRENMNSLQLSKITFNLFKFSLRCILLLVQPILWLFDIKFLSNEEMTEAILADENDLLIAGYYDNKNKIIYFLKNDFDVFTQPISIFKPVEEYVADPYKLSFTDYGHTVRLGEYEVASDAIIYDRDNLIIKKYLKSYLSGNTTI